jgi:hypothetical protein
MTYVRRYPGGFVDFPDKATPIDSQYLNAVENELITLDAGGGGGGDKSFVYTQLSASAVWTVNHNLGKNPAVTVVDTGGNELLVDVDYVDTNNCILTLGAATSGRAFCN